MIVYFEDGVLSWLQHPLPPDVANCIWIDAGSGHTTCRNKLWEIYHEMPKDQRVYTNSLDAFSNTWCWDDDSKIPMIYVRTENREWRLISEMTDKELRFAHNLSKMYIAGCFRGGF